MKSSKETGEVEHATARKSATSTSTMKSKGRGEPVLLARRRGGRAIPGRSASCRFCQKHYRTIIFDCRGTGYTASPIMDTTSSSLPRIVPGCWDIKVSRCHAAGFALGGQIAQALAIQRPDLVATLTIAAAGAGNESDRRRVRG